MGGTKSAGRSSTEAYAEGAEAADAQRLLSVPLAETALSEELQQVQLGGDEHVALPIRVRVCKGGNGCGIDAHHAKDFCLNVVLPK